MGAIRSFGTNSEIKMEIEGMVITSDQFAAEKIEKMIMGRQDGGDLAVRWVHKSDKKLHEFVFTGIKRNNDPGNVTVNWTGSPIDADRNIGRLRSGTDI